MTGNSLCPTPFSLTPKFKPKLHFRDLILQKKTFSLYQDLRLSTGEIEIHVTLRTRDREFGTQLDQNSWSTKTDDCEDNAAFAIAYASDD